MLSKQQRGKILGVAIDNKLNFNNHIKNICSKPGQCCLENSWAT